MTALSVSSLEPEIIFHNGKAITTSLSVAEYFHKRHDNVMDKIRSVIAECDEKYHLLNFKEVVREVPGGDGAMRKMPMYELTRDAFVLIAMGFTGKKALQWKINYINAFNRMEAELHCTESRDIIQGDGHSLLIHFDEHHQVSFTEKVPADAVVATMEKVHWWAAQNGYVSISREELKSLTLAQLMQM
ncbi:Rha family transcriptional regulator [Erwinia amylovora]